MTLAHTPISVIEFLSAIRSFGLHRYPYGIGICVSGGPDSMALAALVSKIRRSHLDFGLDSETLAWGPVRAFIVDHQAREGSGAEAKIVASRLESLGLDSEILQIRWPPGTSPTQMPNFETNARTERYRLLARAAIHNNITNLYLGHHQDDQIETMLMRMTPPREGPGLPPNTALTGMRSVARIPCCSDIYGAFDADSVPGNANDGLVHLAQPGINLVRPFLNFPKSRLEATCQAMGVHYLVDKTNLEPTRTRRNAARHLLMKNCLPRALQKTALIRSQERIRQRIDDFDSSHRKALWDQLAIHQFDLRSGMLLVKFPNSLDSACKEPFGATAHVLTDLLDAISPMSRGSVSLSTKTVEHVFRSLNQRTREATPAIGNNAVTAAGLVLEPEFPMLRLYRQPLRKSEQIAFAKSFSVSPQADSADSWSWTEWLFWDNRYWLRCKVNASESPADYSVRAYSEADVAPTKAILREHSEKHLRTLEETLDDAAPGKIRFTLPVIVKDDHVLAFPTLNILVQAPESCGTWQDPPFGGSPWDVRFKSQQVYVQEACQRGLADVKDEGKVDFWAVD